MKKIRNIAKSSTLVGAFCLILATNGWTKDGKLTEISRPYLGTYECESLYYGGEDKLDSFEYFRLELQTEGKMKLLYREKDKAPKEIPLEYEYDEQTKELIVRGQWGIFKAEKKIPLEKGELNAVLRLGGKQIIVKFKK